MQFAAPVPGGWAPQGWRVVGRQDAQAMALAAGLGWSLLLAAVTLVWQQEQGKESATSSPDAAKKIS
jgi:hypothetical protein